jgi:hypothetical protein
VNASLSAISRSQVSAASTENPGGVADAAEATKNQSPQMHAARIARLC